MPERKVDSTAVVTTGRFAPTPSGPLHFGSLVSALASYCHEKSNNGLWLLRIEDIDTPRIVKGSADDILHTLDAFGFEWDGEVLYQSRRFKIYEEILQDLNNKGYLYGCNCSRKSLLERPHDTGPLGIIYPGNCRHKNLESSNLKLRLKVNSNGLTEFNDTHFGHCKLNLKHEVGDVILKRSDGIYAYHLAVVIDDAFQQVTSIVRGADLLQSTAIHIYLNEILGYTSADYLHIPLIKNDKGVKLSKQTGAQGVNVDKSSSLLFYALQYLRQDIPSEIVNYKPKEILQFAIQHWDSSKIPSDFKEQDDSI